MQKIRRNAQASSRIVKFAGFHSKAACCIGLGVLLSALSLNTTHLHAASDNALRNMELPNYVPPQQFGFASGNIDDAAIGRQLFRRLRQQHRLLEDPELNGWIQALAQRLSRSVPALRNNLHIAIADNPEINAHVLRGHIIVINSGLILSSDSESELAAVLAHEMAHISQRHFARMAAENKNSPWLTGLGVIAGALVASKDPQAGQAIITGATAMNAQRQISYSQRYETEADRTGLRILSRAGFNPSAMPYFLEKLERSESSNVYGNLSKYLRSHPLTIERLSDTRHRAKQAGQRNVKDSADYLYAREKLRVLTARHQNAAHHTLPPAIQNYRRAVVAQQAGQAQRALQLIGQPNHAAAVLLKAQALNTLRRYAEAEQLLRPWLKRLPRHEGLTMVLAQTLLGKGQGAQALQFMRRIPASDKTSLEFVEVGQYIARQTGQHQQAILYNAERRIRMADYRNAILSLQQALRTPNTPPQIKAQLQQKLRVAQQAKQEYDYIRKR